MLSRVLIEGIATTIAQRISAQNRHNFRRKLWLYRLFFPRCFRMVRREIGVATAPPSPAMMETTNAPSAITT